MFEGADGELLTRISGAFAFDHEHAVAFVGCLLLLRSRSKPGTKGEGAVVFALDGGVCSPEVTAIDGGARWDAFAGDDFCEVITHEAFEG